ncbi:MAG TPA: hypothetical protein VLA13_07005 [Massilibacterium sp.]|nr:hypothetical protein [Massilibacterium sp.]
MDEKQLYSELEQLVEDYTSGIISEKEFYELRRRISEDLRELNV